MLKLKTIKYFVFIYKIGRVPIFLPKMVHGELQNSKDVLHDQIMCIDTEKNLFSSVVKTTSPLSLPCLKNILDSYSYSKNNHISILKHSKNLKDISEEMYLNKLKMLFGLAYYHGHFSIHNNILVTQRYLNLKQSNINDIKEKLFYILDKNKADISLKEREKTYLTLNPLKKNAYNKFLKEYETSPRMEMKKICEENEIIISEKILNWFSELDKKYSVINEDNLKDLKQEIIKNCYTKNNLNEIFNNINLDDIKFDEF